MTHCQFIPEYPAEETRKRKKWWWLGWDTCTASYFRNSAHLITSIKGSVTTPGCIYYYYCSLSLRYTTVLAFILCIYHVILFALPLLNYLYTMPLLCSILFSFPFKSKLNLMLSNFSSSCLKEKVKRNSETKWREKRTK